MNRLGNNRRGQTWLLIVFAFVAFLIGAVAVSIASKKSRQGAPTTTGITMAGGSAGVSPLWSRALEQAREQNKPLVVDFYADWCPPCKQMAATTLKNADVTSWLERNAIFLKVNVDHEQALAAAHGIRSIPTVAFFAPSGGEVDRFMGYRGPAEFLAFVKGSLAESQTAGKAKKNGGLF